MNIGFLWSAIHQQLCIVGRSFEARKMVKEALGKVESVRVTSSGFDFMRLRRAEGESIVFLEQGTDKMCYIWSFVGRVKSVCLLM
jgi:hypothetical protein